MGKNEQRARKQAAIKKRAETREAMAEFGLSFGDRFESVGVVMDHVAMSQATFFGVSSINAFCRSQIGIDVALYVLQTCRPAIVPLCPLFNIQELACCTAPLIAVGTTACLEALNTPAPVVLNYMFGIDFVSTPKFAPDAIEGAYREDLAAADIRRAFCDPRVRVVVRGEDYRTLVGRHFGIQVLDPCVPDFEFADLLKILLAEARREN